MTRRPRRFSAEELANSHYKTPALLEHGIRCGKPNCKCASSDHRHRTAYLYWRDEAGRAHRVYVPKADVAAVREIITLRRAIDCERRQMLAEARAYLRYLSQLSKEDQAW